MLCIRQITNIIDNSNRFWIAFGNFLDEFYRQTNDVRQQMIANEPTDNSHIDKAHMALLAASVHKLANDYNLTVPNWVWKSKYYLNDSPFFDCNAKGNLRLLFMYKSPTEFKHRNLFVDENILTRV